MTRRLVLLLSLLALAGVASAGCGEDEKDKFVEDYRPLNDRLLKIGSDLGEGLRSAGNKSNRRLAEQFAGFGLRLSAVAKDIRNLETPDELKDESSNLTARIDDVVKNLQDISGAAGTGDPQAAAAATVELGTTAQALNTAQNKLARATGAKVGRN